MKYLQIQSLIEINDKLMGFVRKHINKVYLRENSETKTL
jgi:hypothetical protein